ncbi:hypothetical protein D3C81_983060 [compost metagenome]
MPITAFIGVRISWLMLARKLALACAADSAACLASASSALAMASSRVRSDTLCSSVCDSSFSARCARTWLVMSMPTEPTPTTSLVAGLRTGKRITCSSRVPSAACMV